MAMLQHEVGKIILGINTECYSMGIASFRWLSGWK